jgi:hypothetical protein
VFGRSSAAALALPRKVKCAVLLYRFRRTAPPTVAPGQIDAQLDAFFDQLFALTAPGRDLVDLERNVADACARIEEWTA